MTRKSTRPGASSQGVPPLGDEIKESAHQIWLAGLGAFTKAQEEGTKVFDALVKEGVAMQRKTQLAAEEKLSEATQKMSSMATDIGAKATGQWDKLESIFEERVAKAMHRLGMPTAKEIQALTDRVEELGKAVEKLSSKPAARKAASPRTAKTSARKPAPKTPSPSGRWRG